MTIVTAQTVVVRGGRITDAVVDDEVVALHIDQGSCFGLNAVASDIWRMLDAPVAVSTLCDYVTKKYDVDIETSRRDVIELLQGLVSVGMVDALENQGTIDS